jgi:vacuolar-type H+-ATPase subunit H
MSPRVAVVVPVSAVAPRGVTGGCCARTQDLTRSSATRRSEDKAQRRQGRLECERSCGDGHRCRRFPPPLYHPSVAENAGSGSSERPPGRATGRPGPSSALAAERVAAIITAAEETAERMRLETEERVTARIAEAQRAADNRVNAAEEEASEALRLAQAEAARLRSEGQAEAEATTTAATNEALAIVARADESASQIVREARESADASLASAEERARGVLEDARATADGVRSEGLELVSNLREMSNSLRANAERLLGDVQRVHSSLTAQIARVERETGVRVGSSSSRRSRGGELPVDGNSLPRDDGLDVPEFIPPS